jgi:hypothetical protein
VIRTDYLDEGFESLVPRGLWVDVRIDAESIEAACNTATGAAGHLADIAMPSHLVSERSSVQS